MARAQSMVESGLGAYCFLFWFRAGTSGLQHLSRTRPSAIQTCSRPLACRMNVHESRIRFWRVRERWFVHIFRTTGYTASSVTSRGFERIDALYCSKLG
jgi:hypothetical protein